MCSSGSFSSFLFMPVDNASLNYKFKIEFNLVTIGSNKKLSKDRPPNFLEIENQVFHFSNIEIPRIKFTKSTFQARKGNGSWNSENRLVIHSESNKKRNKENNLLSFVLFCLSSPPTHDMLKAID